MSQEVLALFRKTGALLDGHFVLRSGLHSRQFFQCALLLQHPAVAKQICGMLADRLGAEEFDSVVSPALGGIIVGHELARTVGKRHIFVEKESGALVLRRGFTIAAGERFLVAEDVVTRGGRVAETIRIVEAHGGKVTQVAAIVDRSGDGPRLFDRPFTSVVQLNVETWEGAHLPADLAAIPVTRPGSH